MCENRLTKPGPLHKDNGLLAAPGWATSLVLAYDRKRVSAPAWRIKEWDYYLINDDEYAVALTLSDLGYGGLISASLIDFRRATSRTQSVVTPFPLGRFKLPATSESGVSQFSNGRVSFRFDIVGGQRRIKAWFARFDGKDDLTFEAVLDEEPRDSMVIATPWAEDSRAFYYNQKIVAMTAQGSFKKGRVVHGFSSDNSFGLLDWGRGVWTRDNTWYWAVAQGWQRGGVAQDVRSNDASCSKREDALQADASRGDVLQADALQPDALQADVHRFGLNLGYGFGDTSAASENMVFVDGVAHKLHRVDFGIPEKLNAAAAKTTADCYELMQPWHMTDDEGRLDLVFTPLLDRVDWMDFKVIRTDQHQVFGRFDGWVILDDKTRFEVTNLLGSAEVIHNVY